MTVAHLAPMLLFLILPKFGVSSQWTLAFVVLMMIGAHVWMMRGHSNHNQHNGV